MARLKTFDPDVRKVGLGLAVMLFDQFTGANQLIGDYTVRLAGRPLVKPFVPFHKVPSATFLFFGLQAGSYTIEVRSDEDTPYYLPVDIPLAIPLSKPSWPAYPDVNLADQTKPLDDPTQSPEYRAQRMLATLQPSTAYQFSAGATLLRGAVTASGEGLEGASVKRIGAESSYVTEKRLEKDKAMKGQYVLFFPKIVGTEETVSVRVTHPEHPTVNRNVVIRRGMTVVQDFPMA